MKNQSKTKKYNLKPKNTTLKKKITNYFCETKQQDICCESEYNRQEIIEEIMFLYKKMFNDYPDEYLEGIANDILIFVGYRNFLINDKNVKGVKLWDYISNKTNKVSQANIRQLLIDLPLYYLLAFLGNSYLIFKKSSKKDVSSF